MLALMNIRFSFLCRATRLNDEGKAPIILRVIYRSERRDIYTGLYCEPHEWNAEAGKLNLLVGAGITALIVALTNKKPADVQKEEQK
jgi:hypothetical protein